MGNLRRQPDAPTLELGTMCGHGMVSFSLCQKMADLVRGGQIAPERGAQYLAKGCTCGIYNPERATRILCALRDAASRWIPHIHTHNGQQRRLTSPTWGVMFASLQRGHFPARVRIASSCS